MLLFAAELRAIISPGFAYLPNIDAGAVGPSSPGPGGPPKRKLNPAMTNTSAFGESSVVPKSGATVMKLNRVGRTLILGPIRNSFSGSPRVSFDRSEEHTSEL